MPTHHRIVAVALLGSLLLMTVVACNALPGSAQEQSPPSPPPSPLPSLPTSMEAHPAAVGTANAIHTPAAYVPLVIQDATVTPMPTQLPTIVPSPSPTPSLAITTVFGIGIDNVVRGGRLAADVGTTWVRPIGLDWRAVEPTEGVRNWSAVAAIEADLREAARLGMRTILIVHKTPAWAQKNRGSVCGPIRSDKFDAFGRFLQDAVRRYGAAPFGVKYWEVWNEPDAPLRSDDQGWGCWGDSSDAYYGGRYYAQMLKVAYEQIKEADSATQVLLGGLLANCDPVRPPAGRNCASSKFFEGILVGGGGPYFDGLSYHTYEYYYSGIGAYGNENWHSAWNTTGPVLIRKGRFFKDLMKKYNVTGKFIMDTELALLCDVCRSGNPANYETTKAYYVAQAYAASIAEGYLGSVWYSFEGWFGSGLVDGNLNPKPALQSLRAARAKLGGATYVGEVTAGDLGVGSVAGIMGYKFKRNGTDVWLVWSRDGNVHGISLTTTPDALTDAMGVSYAPTKTFGITLNPFYLEWADDIR